MTAAATAHVIHPAIGPAPSSLTGQVQEDVEGVIKTAIHPEHGEPTDLGELLSRCYRVILGEPFDALLQELKVWISHLQSVQDGPDKVALTTISAAIIRMHRHKMHRLTRPWRPAMMNLLEVPMQEKYITIKLVSGKPVVSAGESYPYWEKY